MSMKITLFKDKNFEDLLDIDKENMFYYVNRYVEGGWRDDLNNSDFSESINNNCVYKITDDGFLVGFFNIEIEDKTILYIKGIQIKKEFQSNGYGSKVLDHIIYLAEKFNCNSIDLSVFKDNKAIQLYERFGFKKIKDKKNNLILMRRISNYSKTLPFS